MDAKNCLQKAIITAEAGVKRIKIEENEVAHRAIISANKYFFNFHSTADK